MLGISPQAPCKVEGPTLKTTEDKMTELDYVFPRNIHWLLQIKFTLLNNCFLPPALLPPPPQLTLYSFLSVSFLHCQINTYISATQSHMSLLSFQGLGRI